MKVILTRDVAKLGKRYTVLEVPDGFALNKLIPQKMAEPATPENLKRVQTRAKEVAAHTAHDEVALRAALADFAATPIGVTAEANAQDHLFKAVKQSDIVDVAKTRGHNILPEYLTIDEAIKSLGTHTVGLKHGAVSGTFTVIVTRK
jgi:large subunit ribosomal protein L9